MPDDASSSTGGGRPAARSRGPKPRIEILVSAPDWPDGTRRLVREAARAALADNRWTARGHDLAGATLSVELADDDRVAALNARWRDRPGPTNVLSFPAHEGEDLATALAAADPDGPPPALGDIILARGTCAREAAAGGVPLADHLALLVVHGCLHCLGHDHVEDDEAEAMEALETRILARLGIRDPRGGAAMPEESGA